MFTVHREEAARDIVDVEREYCSQLWSILEDYMNPLRDSEIFGRREFHLLFPSYIPHLYEQHCILLRKMEERVKKWKTNGVIGDVFAKFTESQDVSLNLFLFLVSDSSLPRSCQYLCHLSYYGFKQKFLTIQTAVHPKLL